MDVPAIVAIIGGIAFLVGLLGGGIEAVQIKIPQLPRWLRFLASLTGVVLIGIAIWLSFLVSGVPTVQPTATGPSIATASVTAPQPTVLPTATVTGQGQAAPPAPTVPQFCAFVTRSQIDELKGIQDVAAAIRKAEELAGYRQNDYEEGETIPAGVLIAIDLRSSDLEQFGVTPVNNQGGWGLFETTREVQAPNTGAYWCIQESSNDKCERLEENFPQTLEEVRSNFNLPADSRNFGLVYEGCGVIATGFVFEGDTEFELQVPEGGCIDSYVGAFFSETPIDNGFGGLRAYGGTVRATAVTYRAWCLRRP